MPRDSESQMSNFARPDNVKPQEYAHSQDGISTQLPMQAQTLPQLNVTSGIPITAAKYNLLRILPNPKACKLAATNNRLGTLTIASTTSFLQPLTRSEVEERTSRLSSEADSQSSQRSSPVSSQGRAGTRVPPKKAKNDASRSSFPSVKPGSSGAEEESRQGSPHHQENSRASPGPSLGTVAGQTSTESEKSPSEVPFINLCTASDTFHGLPILPRKYVRISKEQQDLLDHESSWITSKHGAVHNIPASVQKSTSHHVDQMMARMSKTSQEFPVPVDQGRLISRQSSQESGTDSSQTDSGDSDEEERLPFPISIDRQARHCYQGRTAASPPPASLIAKDAHVARSSIDEEIGIPWSPSPVRDLPRRRSLFLDNETCASLPAQKVGEERDYEVPRILATVPTPRNAVQDSTTCSPGMYSTSGSKSTELRNTTESIKSGLPNQILSSQSSEEDEIELGIPHAIDESSEESDREMLNVCRHYDSSTVPHQHFNNILVERSPQANVVIDAKLSSATKSQRKAGHKSCLDMREPSSDPIIPGTFIEDCPQKTSSDLFHNRAQGKEELFGGHCGAVRCQVQDDSPVIDASTQNGLHDLFMNEKQKFRVAQDTEQNGSPSQDSMAQPHSPEIASEANYTLPQSHNLQISKRPEQSNAARSKSSLKRRRRIVQPVSRCTSSEDDSRDLSKSLSARVRDHRIKILATKTPSVTSARSPSLEYVSEPSPLHASNYLLDEENEELVNENGVSDQISNVASQFDAVPSKPTHANPVRLKDDGVLQADTEEKTQCVCPVFQTAQAPVAVLTANVQGESNVENTNKPLLSFSIFDAYRIAYPEVSISQRTFTKACVYIEWLVEQKKQPHPFLWDDFVRVYSTNYLRYIERASKRTNGAKKPEAMSGLDYYNNEIEQPILIKGILNPENLQQALNSAPEDTAKFRSLFHGKHDAQSGRRNLQAFGDHASESFSPSLGIQVEALPAAYSPIQIADAHPQSDEPLSVVSKKRFFETHSQIAVLAAGQALPGDLSTKSPAIERQPKEKRQRRSLPWSSAPSSQASPAESHAGFLAASKVPTWVPSRSAQMSNSHKAGVSNNRESCKEGAQLGSPILSINAHHGHLSPVRYKRKLGNGHSSSEKRGSLSRGGPSSKAMNTPRKDMRSLQSRSGPLDPVRGWILDQLDPETSNAESIRPPSSVQRKYGSTQELLDMDKSIDFVPRKKRSSWFSSATSTPPSTRPTLAQACTNAATTAEPETQAWEA